MRSLNNQKTNVVPYLERKYSDTFRMESYSLRSIDIPYDEAVCTDSQGRKVKVYVEYQEEQVIMTDDYYGTLKMPEYRYQLQSSLDSQQILCKFITEFSANAFAAEPSVPLMQAMEEDPDQFYTKTILYLGPDAPLEEAQFEGLCQALGQKHMTMYLAVYRLSADRYAEVDESGKASDYLPEDRTQEPLFKKIIK